MYTQKQTAIVLLCFDNLFVFRSLIFKIKKMVKFLSFHKRKRLQKLKRILKVMQLVKEISKTKRKHRFWVRNYLLERDDKGAFANLLPTLRTLNPGEESNESFRTYFRVTPEIYDEILGKLKSKLEKQTFRRKAISPEERFAITLRLVRIIIPFF